MIDIIFYSLIFIVHTVKINLVEDILKILIKTMWLYELPFIPSD